jgi:hypothetical protein
MAKKPFFIFMIFFVFLPFATARNSFFFASSNQAIPLWWEIKILLISDGDYKVNEGKASYFGRYSFTIIWTGSMEKSEDDFILYYENSELARFVAEESAMFPDSVRILPADEFLDKPSFNLNYILRKGESLYFDFVVNGFLIPQNNSQNKFYLNLPSSEENSFHSPEINYDSFVTKGSNHIFVVEKDIYSDSVQKKSSWVWNYQKWHIIQNKPVFFSNSHEVKVEISVKPHFSKEARSGQARGWYLS